MDVKPTSIGHVGAGSECVSQSIDGTWTNLDAQTKSVTRLEIDYSCARVELGTKRVPGWEIAAWAKCHPNDCRWGRAVSILPAVSEGAGRALAEAGSIAEAPDNSIDGLTARFEQGFASRTLTIRQVGDALEVDVATDFAHPDRPDYVARERFARLVH
jgi:hypothetical protein